MVHLLTLFFYSQMLKGRAIRVDLADHHDKSGIRSILLFHVLTHYLKNCRGSEAWKILNNYVWIMYWRSDFLFVRFQIVMEASETETETEMMETIRLLETGGKRTNRARIGSLEENGEVEIKTWRSTNFWSNGMLRELLHPNIQEQKISKLLLQFLCAVFLKFWFLFIVGGKITDASISYLLLRFYLLRVYVRSWCKD